MSLLSEIHNVLNGFRSQSRALPQLDLLPAWTELVEFGTATANPQRVDDWVAQMDELWGANELALLKEELSRRIAARWPGFSDAELESAVVFAATCALRHQADVDGSVPLRTVARIPPPASPRQALLRKIGADALWLVRSNRIGKLAIVTPDIYCREVGLLNSAGVTAAGRILLQLHGRDAVRWLMALEFARSHGPHDEWRCSRDVADQLLKVPRHHWVAREEMDDPGIRWDTLQRLDSLGVVQAWNHDETDQYGYELTEVGREILTELRATDPPPLLTLARSLSADVTAEALRDFGPAGQRASAATVEQAVAQQARNLVHELRNKVVPLKSALERIERGIPADSRSPTTSAAIEMANNIIEELFRFASTTAELSSNLQAPDEWFALGSAVRDAAQSGRNGRLEAVLEFDAAIDELELYGPRPVMVMAIANLVRNAVQAVPDKAPHIRVTLDRVEGEFHIGVQDNGPGISGLARARMFDQGFSTRDGGTGQGLYLARTGVERDFGGRVLYQESELGGAAFVLSLDASRLRKNG